MPRRKAEDRHQDQQEGPAPQDELETVEEDPTQADQPDEDPGTAEDQPEGDQEATTGATAGKARDPEEDEDA
jgi:hypothetical protein